jgi:cephalosporin-C deacetylase-like acetyl esterase
MHIREYLCREARRLTDRSATWPQSREEWEKGKERRRQQYLEMVSIADIPPREERTPLNVRVTGKVDRPRYTIEKLYYESLPRLYVTGNLYLPKNLRGPAPGVLYVCGHSPTQKVHYQAHPRRWAELGFITLVVDTIQYGEIKGYHHGCYYEGWWHWYSRGYTSAGVELWNALRGLDLLQERPEVDGDRLGITGISGGGAVSWWLGAADERVKAVAPVCGTGTLAAHVLERSVDGHCDCMFFINTYGWDLADLGALIAPRALLIGSADRDGIYSIASIRETYGKVKRVYELLGVGERCTLIATPGPHSYHRLSRTGIFSWFTKYLKGEDVPAEEIEDINTNPEAQEPEEVLRVFTGPSPADERTSTIQDSFVPLAQPPKVRDPEHLVAVRSRLVRALRRRTFGEFPARPPKLDLTVEQEFGAERGAGALIAFTSESGIVLRGRVVVPEQGAPPAPTLLYLRSPEHERWEFEGFTRNLDPRWAKAAADVRGVGDTSWGTSLQWHLRRASAIIGRTLASMRVWDTLRALEALRTYPGVDPERIALAARGELGAVALYAALLDGRVKVLLLEDPPATQNAPSRPDGTGPALEMLNVLRFTDLPYVAGLLWPTELVFVHSRPESYEWAEALYRQLGAPGAVRHVKDVGGWLAAV